MVVVDEAHNLIEAINAAYTAHVTLTQVHTWRGILIHHTRRVIGKSGSVVLKGPSALPRPVKGVPHGS